MPAPPHTFGPTCSLYRPKDPEPDGPRPPEVNAQFFYVSALPIDDPLSPIPPVASDSNSAQSKYPPQPFSARDNAALEEAWIGYQKHEAVEQASTIGGGRRRSCARQSTLSQRPDRLEARSAPSAPINTHRLTKDPIPQTQRLENRGDIPSSSSDLDQRHQSYPQSTLHIRSGNPMSGNLPEVNGEETDSELKRRPRSGATVERNVREQSTIYSDQSSDAGTPLPHSTSEESLIPRERMSQRMLSSGPPKDPDVLLDDDQKVSESFTHSLDSAELGRNPLEVQERTPFRRRSRSPSRDLLSKSSEKNRNLSPQTCGHNVMKIHTDIVPLASDSTDLKTSGRPFARVPSQQLRSQDTYSDGQADQIQHDRAVSKPSSHHVPREGQQGDGRGNLPSIPPIEDALTDSNCEIAQRDFVPVGVSRLHLVEIPDLQMKPIYWNPINDVSNVLRSTWFYKNTMIPLDPDLANQLEIGYEYMRPWTDTWQDELNSIAEIGADAELKIVHRLWPGNEGKQAPSRPGSGAEMKSTSAADLLKDDSGQLPKPEYQMNVSAGPKIKPAKSPRLFKSHSVIYVNTRDAQILRPSLLPSPSRGRRPLSAIRKGRQIGVAVVRGFDRDAWEKMHPSKKPNIRNAQGTIGAYLSQSGDATTRDRRTMCPACQIDEQKPKVTDLIFVVHGIGQKLSERVDSFHFTHAINDFRRQVNIELSSDVVQGKLRSEMGGIMVLPINWRLTLSLDNEESKESTEQGTPSNGYHLKDITPETLPAVRNLISDVMLDIPYYLSNHKQKMISAVVTEANRVYRLWCRNNPGFHENGRVHLIAHSLGSAMVMDVLSQQPTKLPKHINPTGRHIQEQFFEFDTRSLFCCGSPAGFFLLLNRANLLPRYGRNKPGADGADLSKGICGAAGTYGCLAVDNVYNVMHYNDPIAYHVNATVDTDYAASLKPAQIPNANPGFFASLGGSFKWSDGNVGVMGKDAFEGASAGRPNINKLPSTIEMDTHDFSREEIAEKRMYLLNDNGQIDYFLSSGGGPLEIQYLSMLSAHSSYWTLQDFIRFVVLEVGRRPGRAGTLPFLRAEKKRTFKAGKIP